MSCACDEIVAQPTSVVGSIGVIFNTYNVDQGLRKLGIYADAFKSGPLKDMGSPFKPLPISADERAVMQGMIDEYYARFLAIVQTKCHIDDQQKFKIATDGRVFSGTTAQQMGLVDQVGGLDDAIALAKKKSGATNAKVIMYKRPFGYTGSIYANTSTPVPQANVLRLELPEAAFLPRGFYYLWEPGS